MRTRRYLPTLVLIAVGLFSMACLLPGMIPLTGGTAVPTPTMEKSADKVLQTLQANNYVRLEALAKEQYTQQDFAKPGTLTFTVKITDNSKPVYFSYDWCAVDQETLQQDFQHIRVGLFFNGSELGADVVHSFSFTSQNNMACGDFGVLITNWPVGHYELKAVTILDQTINDGVSTFQTGNYVQDYTVDVQSQP